MKFNEVKELGEKYLFQNYGRLNVAFEYGKGMYLYDAEGKEYLDHIYFPWPESGEPAMPEGHCKGSYKEIDYNVKNSINVKV